MSSPSPLNLPDKLVADYIETGQSLRIKRHSLRCCSPDEDNPHFGILSVDKIRSSYRRRLTGWLFRGVACFPPKQLTQITIYFPSSFNHFKRLPRLWVLYPASILPALIWIFIYIIIFIVGCRGSKRTTHIQIHTWWEYASTQVQS